MQLLIWALALIDSIFSVFGAVSGINTVTTASGEITLSDYFLNLPAVTQAFYVIFLISIGICAVCTVAAIVKAIIAGGEKKSHAKIAGQSIGSIFVTLAMAVVMVAMIGGADILLGTINKSLNGNNELIMSHEIINVSVGSGYEYDTNNVQGLNEYDEDGNVTYTAYMYAFAKESNGSPKLFVPTNGAPEDARLIVFLDENGNEYTRWTEVYDPVEDKDGNVTYEVKYDKLTPIKLESGWINGKNKDSLNSDIMDVTVRQIFGDYGTSFGFPTGWRLNGMIAPDNFNFLIAYLCAAVILIALFGAVLGLVKRLFDLVLLFIALPGVSATIPLDDGAKFKVWRSTVVSKVMLAFGSVLAVNIFFIIAPTLWQVGLGGGNAFADSVLKVVLIIGGALTISGGQLLFARLVGGEASESREMTQSARTLFAGGATAVGAAKGAGRLAFGTKNASGQRVGGLIKGSAGALGAVAGGANLAGKGLAGERFSGSKFGRGVAATQRALKGYGKSSGWGGGSFKEAASAARGPSEDAGLSAALENKFVAPSSGGDVTNALKGSDDTAATSAALSAASAGASSDGTAAPAADTSSSAAASAASTAVKSGESTTSASAGSAASAVNSSTASGTTSPTATIPATTHSKPKGRFTDGLLFAGTAKSRIRSLDKAESNLQAKAKHISDKLDVSSNPKKAINAAERIATKSAKIATKRDKIINKKK